MLMNQMKPNESQFFNLIIIQQVGKKLEQLQKAMMEILDELKYDDFFNIIAFSTNVEVIKKII